jgi:hypothetical protein
MAMKANEWVILDANFAPKVFYGRCVRQQTDLDGAVRYLIVSAGTNRGFDVRGAASEGLLKGARVRAERIGQDLWDVQYEGERVFWILSTRDKRGRGEVEISEGEPSKDYPAMFAERKAEVNALDLDNYYLRLVVNPDELGRTEFQMEAYKSLDRSDSVWFDHCMRLKRKSFSTEMRE